MSEMHEDQPNLSLHRFGPAAALAGLVGTGVVIAGMFSGTKEAWHAYLFAFVVWASLSLGSLGLLLLMHTVNGKWGLPVLRLLEAAASKRSLAILALLFTPILYTVLTGQGILYKWADPNVVAADHVLQAKSWFLNAGAFTIRAAAYFLLWFFLSGFLSASTLRQDKSMDTKERDKRANWAAPGIVLFVLSITFSFTDWVMSLEPHWSSTMYGVWWVVGMALMAYAFVTIIATLNKGKAPYTGIVTSDWTRDMGNLMLAFTMLWGYTSLSQYLIIWSGNLPEFITYYVNRSKGGWNAIGMATMLGQFFFPFFCLLSPRIKAQAPLLAKLCGWILVMRLLDMYYVITPAMRGTPMPSPWDFIALLGIGGLWTFAFCSTVAKSPLMPSYDPRLMEASAHAH